MPKAELGPARKSKLDALWAEMNAPTKAVSSSSVDPKKEETTPTKSIDDIWKEMSTPKNDVPSSRVGATAGLAAPKKTVKVTENYVFAGETIRWFICRVSLRLFSVFGLWHCRFTISLRCY